ncbi:MAG: hypothetical protein L0H41_04615 [Microlunatus sp.]|nr:hypothetical protein [Microlunatus sp.]
MFTALLLIASLATTATACRDPSAGGAVPRPATAASATPAQPDGSALPPWPAPSDVPARVAAAGLVLGPMGTAEHYHLRLRVIVNGDDVQVPANIGVDPMTGAMSPLHTHETDGTIHVEAHRVGEVFTLGQLFTQWGIELSSSQIGGVKATGGQQVTLTRNGVTSSGNPQDVRLKPDEQIVLRLP